MIKKVLIANRGEIACRIIKTCKKMGIKSIAVFSEADRDALHVQMADEAYFIGPAPAAESYLNIQKLLEAAKESGADAIHPGYGFLSENEDFAKSVIQDGYIWIGPPPKAIASMGDKALAKSIMAEAGVPILEGLSSEGFDNESLFKAAQKQLKLPVLIKAVAGGGGKGMRLVEIWDEFLSSLSLVQREATAAFVNDAVIVEPYLTRPRHIEVQVLADQHGNVVHLFDRDCSVQRHHQKVVEEAPAPNLNEDVRKQMHAVSVQAAQAIGYEGAGTLEFLLDSNNHFYFMEMNTRLQVEHPVTECITGVDLVEQQILVANGNPLVLKQEDISSAGHSIEVRLYAENPDTGFTPSTGTIQHLEWPDTSTPQLRIDTGIESHKSVSPWYDPMIAKIISHDETREKAISILQNALTELTIEGLHCNRGWLNRIISHSAFKNSELSTHFLDDYQLDLQASDSMQLAADFATDALLSQQKYPVSKGWRLHQPPHTQTLWQLESGDTLSGSNNHQTTNSGARVSLSDNEAWLHFPFQTVHLSLYQPNTAEKPSGSHDNGLQAPMFGRISALNAEEGKLYKQGQLLLCLEAMKMENPLSAPQDIRVTKVHAQTNQTVSQGDQLIEWELVEP